MLNKGRHNKFKRKGMMFRCFKPIKFKRFIILFIILSSLLFNFASFNAINENQSNLNDKDNNLYNGPLNNNGIGPSIDNDNTLSGIGGSWNVSHWANRTEYDLPVDFTSGSYDDTASIPLGKGWTGYQLNATVKDLYETRNWVNGTFHCGDFPAPHSPNGAGYTDNDSSYVQDWTFREYDPGTNNDMSGNYYDEGNTIVNGHDVLELRMRGRTGTYDYYDQGDFCSWNTTLNIPRGNIIDGELNVALYPETQYNPIDAGTGGFGTHWDVQILLNDVLIDAKNLIELEDIGSGGWAYIQYPLTKWLDNPNVFPDPLDGNTIELSLKLIRIGASLGYAAYGDYQQVFIDNVSLILNAEVKPEQIGLKVNGTDVKDVDWGAGNVGIEGNWNNPNQNIDIRANFSSDEIWPLGDYDIELTTDLNLFTRKFNQDSYYEKDFDSIGTKFNVENNSIVNWETYGQIIVLDQYEETNMSLRFPKDVNITWVSSNQEPGINILDQCDNSTPGLLEIPVKDITNLPSGYWLFKGISPNYCKDLNIYNNATGVWELNSTFIRGDYINMTAEILKSSIIQDYINETYAHLYIRFPNGTIWTIKNQIVKLDSNGFVKFSPFRIPYISGPYYIAGKYEAIVTWNNSYSNFGVNESGVIYKEFTVIHDSVLEPDNGIYYIENVIDYGIINIEVEYTDKEDNTAIENALVYTKNSTNDILTFLEISPGVYLYEYDTRKSLAGNNTLTVYANSTFYINKVINITIDVTKQTVLTVDKDYISIPSLQNFSVLFNYTELNSPQNGINTTDISTNWLGATTIRRISEGYYNLTCNASLDYLPNTLNTLIITLQKFRYESQSIPVSIVVGQLASVIKLKVNGTDFDPDDIYYTEVLQDINISIKYEDSKGIHLNGADVTLLGIDKLIEKNKKYDIIINATILGSGIDTLTIFANKSGYNPQTISFLVEITERKTTYELWLNRINKTDSPYLDDVPITSSIDVDFKYNDTSRNYISGATVGLTGEGLNLPLDEKVAYMKYSTTINTGLLGIGTKTLTIDALKNNYEPLTVNLGINIRKIYTEVTTTEGESRFEIKPGEDFKLEIELNNLDFGGRIEDAEVSYDWEFGDGELDETDDGIYEVVFEDVPEGTYKIEITVYKEGGLYQFDDYKVTLVVRQEEGEFLLWLILFIVAAIAIGALTTYFVYYYYVLRYPKPVRKVRKYRRTLKKKEAPSVDITSREEAFNDKFKEHALILPTLLKPTKPTKPTKKPIAPDKILKEKIKKPAEKKIKKPAEKKIKKVSEKKSSKLSEESPK